MAGPRALVSGNCAVIIRGFNLHMVEQVNHRPAFNLIPKSDSSKTYGDLTIGVDMKALADGKRSIQHGTDGVTMLRRPIIGLQVEE